MALDQQQPTAQLNPVWMLTFADLLSLILTFFVMLYSMTALPQPKWEKVRSSLAMELNPDRYWKEIILTSEQTIHRKDAKEALDLDYLRSILTEKINGIPALKGAIVQRQDDRLVVSLPHDLLFSPGGAELKEEAVKVMVYLEEILYPISNRIDIYGHSDPMPILDGSYPSNWELSLARAISVARQLKQSGYSHEIKAFGLADSRFQELQAYNPGVEQKKLYQSARRVDIIVYEGTADH